MSLLRITSNGEEVCVLHSGVVATRVNDLTLRNVLHKKFRPDLGILPPVVRWISASRKYILLERAPMVQTISFHAALRNDVNSVREHTFSLPIPWTLYAIELGDDYYPTAISVYALRHKITSYDDQLGVLPLPNYYNTGALCMPARDYNDVCSNVGQGINAAYRIAWHSGFNMDINYTVVNAMQHGQPKGLFTDVQPGPQATPLKLYRAWSKLSLQEISVTKDWIIPQGYGAGASMVAGHHYTVGKLISRFQAFDNERSVANSVQNTIISIREGIASSMLN